jgi:hypothetical protein
MTKKINLPECQKQLLSIFRVTLLCMKFWLLNLFVCWISTKETYCSQGSGFDGVRSL